MNDLVRIDIPALQMKEDELVRVLESSIYPGAKLESIKLVVGYCRAQHLDPMTKPVHIVPMQVKEKQPNGSTKTVWRDVVMPGIELYRTKAARTEEYAGISEAKWGPDLADDFGGEEKSEWDETARAKVKSGAKYDRLKFTYPEWCEVAVSRIVQGQPRVFTSGRVYWRETYATAGNETTLPNAMWKKRPRGQLEKCAEAMALRRAFPEIGAEPTREEMEGKVIEAPGALIEGDVTAKTVEQPRSKTESATPPASAEHAPASENGQGNASAKSGAGADAEGKSTEGKPLTDGAKKTLQNAMQKAGRTETDLLAAGFPKIEQMRFEQHFQKAMDWIKANPV